MQIFCTTADFFLQIRCNKGAGTKMHKFFVRWRIPSRIKNQKKSNKDMYIISNGNVLEQRKIEKGKRYPKKEIKIGKQIEKDREII